MTLIDLRDVLVALGKEIKVPVWHYEALKEVKQYIVWAEDSQSFSNWGSDRMQSQTLEGSIDYFTKTEYDPNIVKIQNALNNGEISWYLNSIQFEKDTGYIHYEWIFEGIEYG